MHNIFIEKEPGYNCEHQTYSNSKHSCFWIDMSSNCVKMLFLLFLNFLILNLRLSSPHLTLFRMSLFGAASSIFDLTFSFVKSSIQLRNSN